MTEGTGLLPKGWRKKRGLPARCWHEARREVVRWGCLRSWLEVPEWPSEAAAYLFVGLCPDQTEGPAGGQDWGFYWLPNSKPHFSTPYELARNVELSIGRMLRITGAADAARVRTPHEWLKWGVSVRVEPPWLKAACGRKATARLIPRLPPRKDDPVSRSPTTSENASQAAKARHAKTDRLKARMIAKIREWLPSAPAGQGAKFAAHLVDEMPPATGEKGVDVETVKRWIGAERRKMKLPSQSLSPTQAT